VEFKNEFDVQAPVDEVWKTVLDLERVAPAMPGAEVLEKVDDDNYKVAIKVKVGPMSMQYRGDVEIVEKDPDAHRAVLRVKAREARGQGNANADVTIELEGRDGSTHVIQAANVQLAGRAAAMGGSVIKEVSAKLVDQFARNLSEMLAGAPAAGAGEAEAAGPAAEPAAGENGQKTEDRGQASAPTGSPQPEPAPQLPPRAAPSGDDDSGVDALGIAASVAADRLRDPRVLFGSFGVVLLIGWLLGRRGAS
jgi:carbon monoxide dehydrogenase subunit G